MRSIRVISLTVAALCSAAAGAGAEAARAESESAPVKKAGAAEAVRPEGTRGGSMVPVSAGAFTMGSDDRGGNEKPAHRVVLDAFHIDRTEVTVAQYAACVEAGKCPAPAGKDDDAQCNWGYSDRGDHPINCVTFSQARTYCHYAGKRLPTEAEWERAARGSDSRPYPWGQEKPTCARAIMEGDGNGCGEFHTWPVGSRPAGASPCGALDMAGNVMEMVADRYGRDYYSASPTKNPTGPEHGHKRMVRGGSWDYPAYQLAATWRMGGAPDFWQDNIGFRCAKSR